MPHVVNTEKLVEDGLMTRELAHEIAQRSRATMLGLVVNTLLCGGILAATFGLILFLADPVSVAVAGIVFMAAGIATLARGSATYAIFGNAAALIGSGMLIAGGAVELTDRLNEGAAPFLLAAGALIAALAAYAKRLGIRPLGFITGAIFLMGAALHLSGVVLLLNDISGIPKALALLWTTAVIAGAGTVVNVRLVTALAIVPFAQMLDTGTGYFHAAYVFYSPESTLTILQMAGTVAALLWLAPRLTDRFSRHTHIFAMLAVVVANCAFLVGSLWGDHVGITFFRDLRPTYGGDYETWRNAMDAFESGFFHISEHAYSLIWAILLTGAAFWAAQKGKRGLFNAAMTFAAIHAYTQAFETFSDEPLVYVIGGLAAIPTAWGVWRLNRALLERREAATP